MDHITGLRKYLYEEIFPQIAPPPYGDIEICYLSSDKPVYLFTEKTKRILTVGKLFKYGRKTLDEAWHNADREYRNLILSRDRFGMNNESYEIISPLGEKRELSALLVTRKASGHLLDHYIARAIYEQRRQKLFQKLGFLAKFLANLHKNSLTSTHISLNQPQEYFYNIIKILRSRLLSSYEISNLEKSISTWWNRKEIERQDTEVLVHGDATPTNFFFDHHKVTGIDLERMCYADRCWDLGFIAAELKHHFMWRAGDKWEAEPFIGHFLWEYVVNLDNRNLFYTVTYKLPLYMALGLLRMVRNNWLSGSYRRFLLEEVKLCLR